VIEVPEFNTSKQCSRCGSMNTKDLPKEFSSVKVVDIKSMQMLMELKFTEARVRLYAVLRGCFGPARRGALYPAHSPTSQASGGSPLVGGGGHETNVYPILILLDVCRYESPFSSFIHTTINWISLSLIVSLAIRFLKVRSRRVYLMLSLILPLSLLPLAFYGLLIYFLVRILYVQNLFLILLFLTNLWSMWVLTVCIRHLTKLSLRNSVFITLYVGYLSMADLFFIKGI